MTLPAFAAKRRPIELMDRNDAMEAGGATNWNDPKLRSGWQEAQRRRTLGKHPSLIPQANACCGRSSLEVGRLLVALHQRRACQCSGIMSAASSELADLAAQLTGFWLRAGGDALCADAFGSMDGRVPSGGVGR
jgi:hypothetical protein